MDKSRLRLDSRRIHGALQALQETEGDNLDEESSQASLSGVLLAPEPSGSRLNPHRSLEDDPLGRIEPYPNPPLSHKPQRDRSSLVRSATLNRLVQSALAQVETKGGPSRSDKEALLSLPLPKEFRTGVASSSYIQTTEDQVAIRPTLLYAVSVDSMPEPSASRGSSPNQARRSALLNRGRGLASTSAPDVAEMGERIMAGRHGSSSPPPPHHPPQSLPPLRPSSPQAPAAANKKISLLTRGRMGRQSDGAGLSGGAVYAGIKLEQESGQMSQELSKIDSNRFHSHRLHLPDIHDSRTARVSEQGYITSRNIDDFDW